MWYTRCLFGGTWRAIVLPLFYPRIVTPDAERHALCRQNASFVMRSMTHSGDGRVLHGCLILLCALDPLSRCVLAVAEVKRRGSMLRCCVRQRDAVFITQLLNPCNVHPFKCGAVVRQDALQRDFVGLAGA